MAEPDAEGGHSPDDPPDSLDKFKAALDSADEPGMDDGTHARPRIHWNSVTDAGGAPASEADVEAPPDRSGFQFDLGGALARLGDHDASDEPSSVPEPALRNPAPPAPTAPIAPTAPPAPPNEIPTIVDDPTGGDPTVDGRTVDAPAVDPSVHDSPADGVSADVAPVAPAETDEDPLAALRGLIDESARGPDADVVAPTPAFQPAPPSDPPPVAVPPVAEPPVAVPPVVEPPVTEFGTIHESTPHDLPVRSRRPAPGSVFDDVAASPVAPSLPATPAAPQVTPASPTVADEPVELPDASPSPAAASPTAAPALPETPAAAPTLPSTPAPSPELPVAAPAAPSPVGLPTLPDAAPAVSPIITEPPASATATPDIHALRSAQLRADRQQHKSRLFGRALLAIFLIAVLIGLALVFGRSYLFPTEWNASLTPVVDEIQESRGADFDSTVPLEVLPTEQYADRVVAATIGGDVSAQLPIWRAAGLADGATSSEQIAAALSERFPVVYDADSDTIYQLADADPARVTAELRIVLSDIFELQRGGTVAARTAAPGAGLAGVSSSAYIAERAVDVYTSGGRVPLDDAATASALPIPIQHELDAIDLLGEAVLVGANVDPASVERGMAYPETLSTVLDDNAVGTAGGLVRLGEQSLADPIALGVDDWSLVWGAHLPTSTVERLIELVTGDSFRPIDRGGTTCFLGVFQTATDTDASQVFSAMLRWAGSAPAGAQALATQLGTSRVQLEACDPGQSAVIAEPGVVADLINRQIARLAR